MTYLYTKFYMHSSIDSLIIFDTKNYTVANLFSNRLKTLHLKETQNIFPTCVTTRISSTLNWTVIFSPSAFQSRGEAMFLFLNVRN
jgi:hypothetical protein